MQRRLGALVLATATTTATLLGLAPPVHAAPTHEVRVDRIAEGDPPEVPVVVGDEIVDGDRAVPISDYHYATLVGTVGDSYVIAGIVAGQQRQSVAVVAPDGTATRLAGRVDRAEVSDDGSRVAVSREGARESRLRVIDTATGEIVARRTVGRWATVLDVDATRVVVSSWSSPTRIWAYRRDTVRRLSRHVGQLADLSSGVFSVYTGDPYDGGCTQMARFRAPRRSIWGSCRERLVAISPAGKRMATIHILADGPGPGRVTLRRTAGRKIADLDAAGYFGAITFEDDRDLLVEAIGSRHEAWVRANGGGVERVTELRPSREA